MPSHDDLKETFLYPLYFERAVLGEFKNIAWATKYLGMIRGRNDNITFGVTPKGCVKVWLGDLLNLEPDEIQKFVKHFARPKRLGQHLTKTQLYAEFVDDSNLIEQCAGSDLFGNL